MCTAAIAASIDHGRKRNSTPKETALDFEKGGNTMATKKTKKTITAKKKSVKGKKKAAK